MITTNQFDLSSNGKRRKKFDGFPNNVVEVEIFQFKRCFFQQAAHPPDDFGGAPVILQNIVHDISVQRSGAAMSGLWRFQDCLCGFGVGQNRAKRLVDFVSN